MRTRIANFFNEIRRCVKNGVKALDSVKPGWEDEVNIDKLKMYIARLCIVGQTNVCINENSPELGFDLNGMRFASWSSLGKQNKMNRSEQWAALGNEWKKVIISRRVQPKSINCLAPNDVVSQVVA